MVTYRQYCPVAVASEIVAERWNPLIVRNLMFGADTFSAIANGVPSMSRSMLIKRLDDKLDITTAFQSMLPSIIAMNGMASRLGQGPQGPGGPMDFPGQGAAQGPAGGSNAPQGPPPVAQRPPDQTGRPPPPGPMPGPPHIVASGGRAVA